MQWYEMAENPPAISSLYVHVPTLQSVSIKEIMLLQSRTLEIIVELSHLPDKLTPKKNHQRYGHKYLRLQFLFLEVFHVSNWSIHDNNFDLVMERTDNRSISFMVTSSHSKLEGTARRLRISWIKE